VKRRLQGSKSNTSPPKKRVRSITYGPNVALINMVQKMNENNSWAFETLAMFIHPASSEIARRMLRSLAEMDLSRIGRCPVCGKFFAKLRKDQKCCPKLVSGCANVFRVRNWRKDYPEKYKQVRYHHAESLTETPRKDVRRKLAVGE